MTTTTVAPASETTAPEPFTLSRLHHRCDRCGAEGFVATAHTHGILVWCGHHYAKHEAALAADERAAVIADNREALAEMAKPTL